MHLVWQQIVNGITSSGPLMLVSLALGITLGYLRVLNVAYGAFLAASAYATVRITENTTLVVVAVAVAVVVGALLTVLLEPIVLRPMRRRANDVELGSFIATFAVSLALTAVVQSLSHSEVVNFPTDYPHVDKVLNVIGLQAHLLNVIGVVVAITVAGALYLAMKRTSVGKSIRALASDWEAAELVGVRVASIAITVAVVTGALVGAAGFLSAAQSRGTNFLVGDSYLLLAFVVAIVGGVGNIAGTAIAAIVVTTAQALISAEVSSELSQAVIFAVLFVFLLLRPEGALTLQAGSSASRTRSRRLRLRSRARSQT